MKRTARDVELPWAKYPGLRIALLLGSGIGLAIGFDGVAWNWIFAILLSVNVGILFWERRASLIWLTRWSKFLYLLTIVLGGAWYYQARVYIEHQGDPPFDLFTWEEVSVNGVVDQVRHASDSSKSCMVDIEASAITFADSTIWTVPTTVRARYHNDRETHLIQPGYELSAVYRIYPLEKPTNPYLFDYRAYLKGIGVASQGKIISINKLSSSSNSFSIDQFRSVVAQTIDSLYTSEQRALAKAIIMGQKNDLSDQTRDSFIKAGLAHIMAVSGLHVGILVGLIWLIIPYIWGTKLGRWIALVGVIVLCLLYAALAGFPASVMRASVMAIFMVAGKLFSKQNNPLNLLGVAAIVILLLDPTQITDVGFQLSFSALVMIIVVWNSLFQRIPRRIRSTWWMKWVGSVVLMSAIIQLGLLPFLAYYFQQISLIGPLLNIIALPLISLFLPWTLLCMLIYPLWPWLGQILNMPAEFILMGLDAAATLSSSWYMSWISINLTTIGLVWVILICVLLVWLAGSWDFPRVRWKLVMVSIIVVLAGLGVQIHKQWKTPVLTVTMLDVEQGDAIIVSTPSGKHFLIDTGRWTPSYSSGDFIIRPILRKMGINRLEAVLISHPHADHMGGLPDLLEDSELSIKRIIMPPAEAQSELFERTHYLADSTETDVQYVTAGDTLRLDPQIYTAVLNPRPNKSSSNLNDISLVVRVDYGDTSFLFTGDAERNSESWMVHKYGEFLDTDVLKVGHHGSKTSSTEPFIQAVTPKLSLVSLGWKNRYNHPHQASIFRLKQAGNQLFYTSRSGAIIIKSDGTRLWREYWR